MKGLAAFAKTYAGHPPLKYFDEMELYLQHQISIKRKYFKNLKKILEIFVVNLNK